MAMTKAEKAQMEAYAVEAALRWPSEAEPRPMTAEEIKAAAIKLVPRDTSVTRQRMAALGWSFNAHNGTVGEMWSETYTHGRNHTGDMASQGMGKMYRTPHEARVALRWALCREFAAKLRNADRGE